MTSITIRSGPVGAGKTTVAHAFVAASPVPITYIEGDIFWSFIAKGTGTGRHKNFRTSMLSMMAAAVPYALADFAVLLDFSIPPWFLDRVRAVAERREVPVDYVVLRPSEAICAARAAARREGTIADYAPYRDLYLDFDAAERYIIQDDESPAPIVAARMREGLEAGRFRLESGRSL